MLYNILLFESQLMYKFGSDVEGEVSQGCVPVTVSMFYRKSNRPVIHNRNAQTSMYSTSILVQHLKVALKTNIVR